MQPNENAKNAPLDVLERAETDRQKALKIAEKCGIVAAWEGIGATVSLVGSVRIGVFTTAHRDVDFHLYTDKIDVERSFSALGKIAATPGVYRVDYSNFLETEERCLQWRVWFADANDDSNENADNNGETVSRRDDWAIDLVQIEKNSRYDGYFERVADRIAAVLTSETRRAILEIKTNLADRLDAEKITGVEIYRAVLDGGVRDVATFLAWRAQNPVDGVLEWSP